MPSLEFGAYDAITRAKKEAERLRGVYYGLTIPKGLDKETKKALEDAKLNLGTAFSVKSNGMGSMLKFLDSNKPSDLQKATDDINMSQSFLEQGSVNLMTARRNSRLTN